MKMGKRRAKTLMTTKAGVVGSIYICIKPITFSWYVASIGVCIVLLI